MRAMACLPTRWARSAGALSPNRKRHIARLVIWSLVAAALVAELGYVAVDRLA